MIMACSLKTYKDVLVELPDHQDDSLILGQVGIMDDGEAFGCVDSVGLVVDERGQMRLVAIKLNDHKLIALLARQRKQKLKRK